MHLIAYFESQDSAVLVNVAALADNTMIPEGTDGYQVPNFAPNIFAAAALGTDVTRARLIAPSLERRRSTQDVWPLAESAESFALTHPQVYMPKRSVALDVGEVLTFQGAEDGVGAGEIYGLVFLEAAAGRPAMPPGEIIQVRATGTTVLVVDTWSTVALTLEQELPAGRYACVGFVMSGVSPIAARLVIPGQAHRPGMPALIGATTNVALNADFGQLEKLMYYNMGEFTNTAIPQLEVLAAAADTAQEVQLLLIKVA